MFCEPELIFGGSEGVGSRFHVLPSRTRFWRFRGRRVPFLRFALPDSFFAVLRALGTVLMFCTLILVFGRTEGVGSHFLVLRARNHFRRVLFSCFARPDSFSAVPRASGPVFMFCAPGLIFYGVECTGSLFHVLRSRAPGLIFGGSESIGARVHFRRYRGGRVQFTSFALPESFSAVRRASGPVLHILRSQTRFWRYRWRRVPFSCFSRPDSFSAVPRASGPVFMFCAPGLVFGGTEGVGSRFHVLRCRTRFRWNRRRLVPF
jgi:hypothetical protein